MTKAGIVVVSDKCASGLRVDTSGEVIKQILISNGYYVVEKIIVPDEVEEVCGALYHLCDKMNTNLVITTGGTGLSVRDITPQATKMVIEKEVVGISQAIVQKGMEKTDRAMLTCGVSGVYKQSLIINLPGSEKAVRESLDAIMSAVNHGVEILTNKASECGR